MVTSEIAGGEVAGAGIVANVTIFAIFVGWRDCSVSRWKGRSCQTEWHRAMTQRATCRHVWLGARLVPTPTSGIADSAAGFAGAAPVSSEHIPEAQDGGS